VCRSCGCVQKFIDNDFKCDCKTIYNSYSVYHQSQGQEQRVFEQSHGESRSRSELLLAKVSKQFNFPSKGCLLDIGCGNGNLLRSFSKLFPSWVLAGSELSEKYKRVIEQIKNVKAFYSCDVEEIHGQYDMITMLHCLEHIINPVNFLKKLRNKITPEGLLLVELPDYTQNPFDLIIADHCSHFYMENVTDLFRISGFDIKIASNNYISKELTFLVCKNENDRKTINKKKENSSFQNITRALQWLRQIVDEASKIGGQGRFGLFGTSIAATWLCSELGDVVTFFVDEDPNRINTEFMGRKVYHPEDVPGEWNVFIALPFPIARDVWKRMKSCKAAFYLPPVWGGIEENK
jgi:trans-aconitate methyltransferase